MGVNKAFLKGGKGKARASMPSTAHKAAAQKAPAPAAAAPVKQPRTKIVPKRLNGTLTQWRGNFGWIKPDEPINHPAAAKRPGKVYVGHEDVEAEIAGVGHPVSFFAYVDHAGVGAMNVRPGKPAAPGVQKAIVKTAQKPAAKAKTAAAKPGAPPAKKKAVEEPRAPLDKSLREQVSGAPMVGTVTRVRGKAGWIRPEEPVAVEGREKPVSEVFLLLEDVDGDEQPLAGAEVMFFLYKDSRGYGAEHCQIMQQGDGAPPPKKAEGGGEGGAAEGKKRTRTRGGRNAKKESKPAKEQKERGPSGPDLPRERVTTATVTGEIIHYVTDRFGWIRPTSPIEHEASEKNKGKIYFHPRDVEGTPAKGATVTFQVYSDSSGLGAEEVVVA